MISRREFHNGVALLLAAGIAATPAHGLVTLNDGRDRIYVTGTASMNYDSNVFASNGSEGDIIYNAGISADYSRRAGWISVGAVVGMNFGNFTKLKSQNFSDPSLSLEFTKQTGRTTGAVTISAARESRADAAVNSRSTSWNLNYGANFRYGMGSTYDLSGGMSFSQRKYQEDLIFSNLSTYSTNLDLSHVLNNQRDVMVGYRFRFAESARDTSSTDHGINVGLNGRLILGVNGSVRVGYQTRIPSGVVGGLSNYDSWTASGSASYPINKKFNISGSVSKDFSTTATDSSVDALTATLDAQYAFNSRLSLTTSLGWGDSQFLGDGGRIQLDAGPPVVFGPNRHDNYLNFSASTGYAFNEHLKLSLSYTWFKNWSTIQFADFVRNTWSLGVSSRW